MTRAAVVALVVLGLCVVVGAPAATGGVTAGDGPTGNAIPTGGSATGNVIPMMGIGTADGIAPGSAISTGGAAAGEAIAAAGVATGEAIPMARTAAGDAVATSGAATASVSSTRDVSADLAERRVRQDYLLSCAGCHGLDAAGSVRVPSLRGVDRLLARPGGRAYVLRVPGVTNSPLSDERLATLLDWIFSRFDNHTETHFTAAEVAAGRAAPFVDPKAARAALE